MRRLTRALMSSRPNVFSPLLVSCLPFPPLPNRKGFLFLPIWVNVINDLLLPQTIPQSTGHQRDSMMENRALFVARFLMRLSSGSISFFLLYFSFFLSSSSYSSPFFHVVLFFPTSQMTEPEDPVCQKHNPQLIVAHHVCVYKGPRHTFTLSFG